MENSSIKKILTGIKGMDEITGGGLPKNRTTLVCGGPGCGKTLLAMEIAVNGIVRFDENGVYISFDESKQDLVENVASLGFDIKTLIEEKKLCVIDIPQRAHIDVELGSYDLGGLFAMLSHALDSVRARRVVIDGIDSIFSVFQNEMTIRLELKKLFNWLKERDVTTIVTCERGEGKVLLSRHGIEEYTSDCVILLDQRVIDQIAVRRLKILKYRGTLHGTNEYPFLMTSNGISIFPITSMMLRYSVKNEHVPTGISGLDQMLSNKGFFKGSSILVSGTTGTGKSSIAGHFAASICKQDKRCIYFAFEEPADQIVRNMSSIGLDLSTYVNNDLLTFHASRPTEYGVEMHLLKILKILDDFKPDAVVFDPISNLTDIAAVSDIKSMLARMLDYLKNKQITILSTNLIRSTEDPMAAEVNISSLMDTCILVKNSEENRKKTRFLDIVKSRGMAHADMIHEFSITNNGIVIKDI